jgi:hypothetical protein
MVASFKEYITSLGHWGWLVMADFVLTITGAWLDLSATAGFPTWLWLTLGLVGLIVAPFFAFHKVREQRDKVATQLAQATETHPTITVEPIVDPGGRMFLEVTNHGEHGDFQAQIEVVEGREFIHGVTRPPLPAYSAFWQVAAGPVARLPQGHKDRVAIGHLSIHPGIWLASFEMYFFSHRDGHLATFDTTSWMPGSKGALPARFLLRITVSASPKLQEGAFCRLYLAEGGGEKLLREATESQAVSSS